MRLAAGLAAHVAAAAAGAAFGRVRLRLHEFRLPAARPRNVPLTVNIQMNGGPWPLAWLLVNGSGAFGGSFWCILCFSMPVRCASKGNEQAFGGRTGIEYTATSKKARLTKMKPSMDLGHAVPVAVDAAS